MERIYIDSNLNNSGRIGCAVEQALKAHLSLKVSVSKAGRSDMRKDGHWIEVKTQAGELGNVGEKLIKGSSMVVYIPVPRTAFDAFGEYVDLEACVGYVLTRDNFLLALSEAGAIRTKRSTAGQEKVTIQTFWNTKQNKPHGRLLERMTEQLELYCYCDLQMWLSQFED